MTTLMILLTIYIVVSFLLCRHLWNEGYWDFFWWATKKEGVKAPCHVDRMFFEMPKIIGWIEVPDVE